jgi:CBS domain-containing protein
LLTPTDLARVERAKWNETTIRDVTHPLEQMQSVSPDTPVVEALRRMGREDINQLPVVTGGRMQGVLSRSHILHVLQTRAELSM